MDRAAIHKWIIFSGVIGSVAMPTEADAGFLDFFRRREPTVAYYPPTATPAPAPAAACGPGYCEQTVLRYVPQTAYRTVWQPVPVTTYRRTVSYNPATGLPMTCTQPCTSYTYQARRVPYTTFRPVYQQVPVTTAAGCNSCQTNVPAPTTATPYYQTTPSTTVVTPQTPTPSFGSPPTTTDPAGATPWEPATPVSPAPAGDGFSPPPPTTTDPADDRPRIDPQPGDFSSMPRTSPPSSTTGIVTTPNLSSTPPASDPFNRRVPTSAQATWTSDGTQSTGNSGTSVMSPQTPSTTTNLDIRPIPRVEKPQPTQSSDAPPLLNHPRDNTAALIRPIPTNWESNRIQWERQVSHDQQEANPTNNGSRRLNPHRIQQSQPPQWDDSGWRSAKK